MELCSKLQVSKCTQTHVHIQKTQITLLTVCVSRTRGCGSFTPTWSWTWFLSWQVRTSMFSSTTLIQCTGWLIPQILLEEICSFILRPKPGFFIEWNQLLTIFSLVHWWGFCGLVNVCLCCFSHGESSHPRGQRGSEENVRPVGGKTIFTAENPPLLYHLMLFQCY